jgi:transposase-like protein
MMTMASADLPWASSGRATRRKFSAQYKERIVAEYDGLSEHGQRGALLRREGLYQSHIDKWRKVRDAGRLAGTPAAGAAGAGSVEAENARLRAQVEKLDAELSSTKAVLDIVGKASGLLARISDRQEPPRR